ncbi:CTD small phosphatase-like protein [Striga asiatica]|uniref:CTD small phosphatase-like protein n=1 Tax=Striga asiatica TaxID=4170 RepID=A0A5A7NZU3_STRAF|nr:CTD small phosphatase-like protein [Striga asiatica]
MVSKIVKRTPTKSLRNRNKIHGRRRKSPAKSPTAAVVASINRSIHTCRRRLKVEFFVLKRPFVDEFLSFLSRSSFEIVIFTAGIEEYASLVIDRLDPKGLISYRLYRDSCREIDGRFVKDLESVGRELDRAVIVDDNPCSYQLQPSNAVPVRPFTDDLGDEELKGLMGFFGGFFDSAEDVRDAVRDYLDDLNVVGEKFIYSV